MTRDEARTWLAERSAIFATHSIDLRWSGSVTEIYEIDVTVRPESWRRLTLWVGYGWFHPVPVPGFKEVGRDKE